MSRSMVCASITNDLMGMAVSYLFATPSFVQAAEEKVGEMVDDIRNSFIERVHKLDWMDEETRLVTLRKVNAMKVLIAFPKWMLQAGELDKYYYGLKLDPGNFLMNAVKIMEVSMKKMLMSVVLPNTVKMETWASDPTDVNAYYSFQDNAITIPAAILQFPFYNMGLEVLNYGAIGTILGHELTHGFDTLGRLYDDAGNFRPWWTNKTAKEYMRRSSCFIYQYSNYRINDVHANVDGYMTLGENIADNGGIHEAVEAYKKLAARHGHSLNNVLPGLESLKPDQLFYLSYANLWCEQSTPMAKKWAVKGNHAPNPARIWGSLSNSKHFAKTWNCPLYSPMNPQKKCELW
ncbi:hypothetical protein B566_EDAN008480 [Ephemera danica]|nr:hypothetical protein B566_EDAN008480 [Ephemera danica]